MKKTLLCVLCAALCICMLAGCGAPDLTGVSSSAALSGPASGASAPVSSSAPASSAPAASASTAPVTPTAQQFVSLHVSNEDKLALLVLQTPTDWSYDNINTFSKNQKKVAEASAIWKVDDPAAPLTDAMTAQYADDAGMFPEGYGLVSTIDRSVNGNLLRTYLYKTWPDDADEPWYPHYCFYVTDGYVVQMIFYSADANSDDATFDSVLSSIEIHFGDTQSSTAAGAA